MLEAQLEAAAGGRFEGLLGVVVEVVAVQAATGRCKWKRARAQATPTWAKEGGRGPRRVRARVAAARVLAQGRPCAPCMRRPRVGCARAGLVRGTRREWLVAFKARAGRC